MTNFQPEQASDNTAAPSNTSDLGSLQTVYSDLGSSYMRDAASLSGSSSSTDSPSRSSSDLQDTLNAGLQNTDQLYGASPTSGLGANRETGDAQARTVSGAGAESPETPAAQSGDLRNEVQPASESPDSRSEVQPASHSGDLRSEMQRRAEHRSDVQHDRPEMSMARSAGGG
jgi:hypothetical protein